MTKRRVWVALFLIGIALLVGAILVRLRGEPEYQNRRLSSWLEDLPPARIYRVGLEGGFHFHSSPFPPNAAEGKALQALRSMGTNALPELTRMVRSRDNSFNIKLIKLARKQSFVKVKLLSEEERRARAFSALWQLEAVAVPAWTELLLDEGLPLRTRQTAASALGGLGTNANGAVPALLQTLIKDRDVLGKSATESILRIGPEATVPFLIRNLSSTNAFVRSNAAFVLGNFGQKAQAAIPALLNGIDDADPDVHAAFATGLRNCEPDIVLSLVRSLKYDPPSFRAGAASSLGVYKQKAEIAVPALVESVGDQTGSVREAAVSALGDFGVQARMAVPTLLKACTDPDKSVRIAATNALKQIDRERAGN